MALTPDVVAQAKTYSSDGRISVVVVGCVWYRTVFEPKSAPSHQTQFVYLLAKRLGPPVGTFEALQSGIPIGIQPSIDPTGIHSELELIPQALGNSAD